LNTDVKQGDVLVTSGLGGRFPAGFPVGTVTGLRSDDSRAFLVGELRPAAQLDRGRDVLLLRSAPQAWPAGLPTAGARSSGVVALGATTVSNPAASPLVAPARKTDPSAPGTVAQPPATQPPAVEPEQ